MNIMKNKNIFKIIVTLCLFFLISPVVRAEVLKGRVATAAALQKNVKEEIASKKAELQKNITGLKKDTAFKEIDRRISAMTKLISKINLIKRLTDLQKSTLVTQVNAEIARLTALKTKIGSDVNITTLTADKKTIVSSYRTYAFFLPKMTIITQADAVLNLADLMAAKVATGEALTKINVAKTLAEGAISNVVDLTPEGYPANKIQLQTAQRDLQTARLNLTNARPLMK